MEALLNEFREEVATTKKCLERVPADRLSWKPHPKSMSLGQLSNHIAMIPGRISKMTQLDGFDAAQANFVPPQPKDKAEVLATFEVSAREGEDWLKSLTAERAQDPWRLSLGDKEIFTKSRGDVVRSIMLNHWYHHRGQLSVYLRLLDVPVPIIYGRSADETPFG